MFFILVRPGNSGPWYCASRRGTLAECIYQSQAIEFPTRDEAKRRAIGVRRGLNIDYLISGPHYHKRAAPSRAQEDS